MNVARKVSLGNGSLHSNSFSASWCAKLEPTPKCCFCSLKLEIHFLSFFFLFFFFGNLQHYLSLYDVTNVSKFPKEALEGRPL